MTYIARALIVKSAKVEEPTASRSDVGPPTVRDPLLEVVRLVENARAQAHREECERAKSELAIASEALRTNDANDAKVGADRTTALAVTLAEALVHEALNVDPSPIVDMAREALAGIGGARRVTIEANVDDLPALKNGIAEARIADRLSRSAEVLRGFSSDSVVSEPAREGGRR